MIYLILLLFISLVDTSIREDFPTLESDGLLLALEAQIAETLKDDEKSDIELQSIEGSGDYLIPIPTKTTTIVTTTTTIPTTTTGSKKKNLIRTCLEDAECFKDSDCPMGQCRGSELGICDCNACIPNKPCSSDSDCGGLINGCDTSTNLCDCVNGFHLNGFKLFIKAVLTFCHRTKCSNITNNCYGLPCRVGKCVCGPNMKSNQPVHYFTG